MSPLQPFVLAAVLCGSGDATLLEFTASWCGPCQSMQPTIQRLHEQGYAVRQIDVDQNPELARRFGVRPVPCFVMLSGGREIGRLEGATSYENLVQLYQQAGAADAGNAPPDYRGQSPDPAPDAMPGLAGGGPAATGPNYGTPAIRPGHPESSAAPAYSGPGPSRQLAMQATVRLKVMDGSGNSFGTGTIIDTHGDEALVLTCGHIFRDSKGQCEIHVDLFAPGVQGPVQGQLVDYEAEDRDIALVSIRPGIRIRPIPVAPPSYRPQTGTSVFSIGCDHGANPSIRESSISAVDRYIGPPNVEILGQPVLGRSGGGLFSTDGLLIGVCNAADPQEDRGIYASLPTIHWQLKHVGLDHVYMNNESPPAGSASTDLNAVAGSQVGPMSGVSNLAPLRGAAVPDPLLNALHVGDTELMLIVRSKSAPNRPAQLLQLKNPSQELVNQLMRESAVVQNVDAVAGHGQDAVVPLRQAMNATSNGPFMRAQNN